MTAAAGVIVGISQEQLLETWKGLSPAARMGIDVRFATGFSRNSMGDNITMEYLWALAFTEPYGAALTSWASVVSACAGGAKSEYDAARQSQSASFC